LLRISCSSTERGDEDRVESFARRSEELHDGAIVEREPRGAEALGIGAEVRAAADDARGEVGETIAAIAEARQQCVERGQEVQHGGGVGAERLAKLKAPAGLDLGAITPDEIAVSVVAEIVAVRRSKDSRSAAAEPSSLRG